MQVKNDFTTEVGSIESEFSGTQEYFQYTDGNLLSWHVEDSE